MQSGYPLRERVARIFHKPHILDAHAVPALLPDAADRLAAVHEHAVEIPPRVADALARIPEGLPRMAQPVHKARFFLADAGVDLALGDLLRRLALNALRLLALPRQLREPVQIAPDRRGVVLDSFLRALLRHLPETFLRSLLELRDDIQQLVLRLALIDRIPDIRVTGWVPLGDVLDLLAVKSDRNTQRTVASVLNYTVIAEITHRVLQSIIAHSLRVGTGFLLHLFRKTAGISSRSVIDKRICDVQICLDDAAPETFGAVELLAREIISFSECFQTTPAFFDGFAIVEHGKVPVFSPRPVVHHHQPPVLIPDRAVPEIRLLRLAELVPLTVLGDGKFLLDIVLCLW